MLTLWSCQPTGEGICNVGFYTRNSNPGFFGCSWWHPCDPNMAFEQFVYNRFCRQIGHHVVKTRPSDDNVYSELPVSKQLLGLRSPIWGSSWGWRIVFIPWISLCTIPDIHLNSQSVLIEHFTNSLVIKWVVVVTSHTGHTFDYAGGHYGGKGCATYEDHNDSPPLGPGIIGQCTFPCGTGPWGHPWNH
jgi:hypothetical protein